jgi:hypothetical protein
VLELLDVQLDDDEQQLEVLHDELLMKFMSVDGSTMSTTSKVAASSASNSVGRVPLFIVLLPG